MASKESRRPTWHVREWRERRQLTQEQLADLAGMTKSMISEFESGKKRLNDDHIAAFCAAFRVEPAELLAGPHFADTARRIVPHVSWVSAGAFGEVGQAMPDDEFPAIEFAGLPPGDWFALTVEGDSMDRISPPGSIIFVNRRDKKLVPNACYVIANEAGHATYKRYRPNPERFEPVSVNPAHDAIYPDGAVTIIGRVMKTTLDLF